MAVNREKYRELIAALGGKALLVAVSKVRTVEEIRELYDMGQRDFGENYVQELIEKQSKLPSDIRWHFIGHMQSNKVKHIAPFVYLIQGVDSYLVVHNVACIYAALSESGDDQAAANQEIAMALIRRAIALWKKADKGPNEIDLIRTESAFRPLINRKDFQELIRGPS